MIRIVVVVIICLGVIIKFAYNDVKTNNLETKIKKLEFLDSCREQQIKVCDEIFKDINLIAHTQRFVGY